MEIGILQLFWLVLIIVIFVASAIKRYLSNKKAKDRFLSRENVRERKEVERPKPRQQQNRSEWAEFMGDMFGIEPIKIQTERRPKKRREPTKLIETDEEEQFEDKSTEAVEPGIQELHATIEDRHIKSEIGEDVIKPPISEPQITSTVSGYGKEYVTKKRRKRVTAVSHSILRKEGLKNAIIYSEIIGPPIGLRKRSLLRHIR